MNSRGSCSDNCAAYQVAEPLGCYKDMFCAKQSPCQGRLFDCQFFHADAWVCLSQDRQRKYDWIEYENGIQLGRQDQCISMFFFFYDFDTYYQNRVSRIEVYNFRRL